MLGFNLGHIKSVDPALDEMGRTWVGYGPNLDDETVYEANRGSWNLGPAADAERYAFFVGEGRIRVVVEVERVETLPVTDPSGRVRRAIVGRVLPEGHPVRDALHLRESPFGARNVVGYFPALDVEDRLCGCGCGVVVGPGRTFSAGHDQRAVHERITSTWGSTIAFVRWHDSVHGDPGAERAS